VLEEEVTSSGVGGQTSCLKHHVVSVVSVTDNSPRTNVSQFFIHLYLDTKYTVFGKVLDSLEVSDELEKSPVSEKTEPHSDVCVKN
ncbi:hypothetical protein A6R68_04752, partial [Neotoma lepida]